MWKNFMKELKIINASSVIRNLLVLSFWKVMWIQFMKNQHPKNVSSVQKHLFQKEDLSCTWMFMMKITSFSVIFAKNLSISRQIWQNIWRCIKKNWKKLRRMLINNGKIQRSALLYKWTFSWSLDIYAFTHITMK